MSGVGDAGGRHNIYRASRRNSNFPVNGAQNSDIRYTIMHSDGGSNQSNNVVVTARIMLNLDVF